MSARTKKLLRRYWGWLALALAILGWFSGFAWPVLIALSLVSAIYFLFQAKFQCGVPTTSRDRHPCRRNTTGLLIGCHLTSHKRQRLKMLISPEKWGNGLWDTPKDRLNTLAALATVFSFAGSVIGAAR